MTLLFLRETIIAEVAQVHDGSLGTAHAMIDAAADAGAHAVKFQTHIADAESTFDEPWRVRFSCQDSTRFDYWKRMEFRADQWAGLVEHADRRGLMFLSSPFSVEAVRLLDNLGMALWKIPSGEIGNPELLDAVLATKKPILFSTGLCTLSELDNVVNKTKNMNVPFGIFQCTSEYPSRPETWGLNVLQILRDRYQCEVGFSDHSGTIYAGLAAATLGARFIEVHVTFDRKMFGPDVPASITFAELALLTEGVKKIAAALNTPLDKDESAQNKQGMKYIFGRSWTLKKNLSAGAVLSRDMLMLKKPGSGFKVDDIAEIVGKKLKRDTSARRILTPDDLE